MKYTVYRNFFLMRLTLNGCSYIGVSPDTFLSLLTFVIDTGSKSGNNYVFFLTFGKLEKCIHPKHLAHTYKDVNAYVEVLEGSQIWKIICDIG